MIYTTASFVEAIKFGVACRGNVLVLSGSCTGPADFFPLDGGKIKMGVLRTLFKFSRTPSSVLPHRGAGGRRGG